jgi:hypothetical protein
MKHHTAVLGIVALCLIACDPGDRSDAEPPEGPLTEARREALCADVQNQYECSRLVEAQLLRRDAPASRAGDTLKITLASGEVRTFADHGTDADAVRYTYDGKLTGIGYHVVQLHYYEGGAHLLIDDSTGEAIRVPGPPVASPDGRWIAIASYGGLAGYTPDLIQIRRVADGLPVAWELSPDDWGAESPHWVDSVTVRFTRLWTCDQGTCETRGELRRQDGDWSVVADLGADAGSSSP